jgi:hypothetical protein
MQQCWLSVTTNVCCKNGRRTVIGTMYHMLQWLPLLSVVSMRLRSSIQCSSTQKTRRHSHDPVVYMAKKEV